MEQNTALIKQMRELAVGLPAPLFREVEMIIHKMTYPMRDILAQVPGDSLTEKAKRLKVSRQTMYVWTSEKYRPTRTQAKRIARVTDVPIEHIIDDGFEHDPGKAARKKVARLATRRKKIAKRNRDAAPKRQRARKARNQAVGA